MSEHDQPGTSPQTGQSQQGRPRAGSSYDARTGDGDPRHDPAAVGEVSAHEPDGDGGATPDAQDRPEPGTG